MEKTLKKEGKIGEKNPGKYMHKLKKQQRERWRHVWYPSVVLL